MYDNATEVVVGDNQCTDETSVDFSKYTKLQSITIGDGSFSNANSLLLSGLNELVSITIGDDCFSNVNELHLEGLLKLENVTIGMNSFTQNKNNFGSNTNRKFYLKNCTLLKEVHIGRYSFSDYTYSYVESLDSLELLEFGDVTAISYNFYSAVYASFLSDLYK